MNNIYKAKQSIIIALVLIIIGTGIMQIRSNKQKIQTPEEQKEVSNEVAQVPTARNLCYYRADKTASGFYNKAWIKLSITDDKITGEFQNLPAEKDSKVGTFEGTVGPLDQMSMSRTANVWWNSQAEGMEVKEELVIKFGDGSATVGFGEMVNRGDGVYIYKSKDNLYYIKQMNQMDCEFLDEKNIVEKYVKDNIATIATNKPVLGGTWYTTSVTVIPSTKTGEVTYEDGHVQSSASFIYTYEPSTKKITFSKFELKK